MNNISIKKSIVQLKSNGKNIQ